MLVPPDRYKRARSPSPPFEPDLASPLDVLLKRRRREELPHSSPGEHGSYALSPASFTAENDYFALPTIHHGGGPDESPCHAESSAAAMRRSMAGVERRRTKHWELQNAPSQSQSNAHSQPTPPPSHLLTPNVRTAYSQPNPMSSSPIRNMPPSSSPFRDKGPGVDDTSWMEEDEMRREWGEEYAAQNSLLHSLHMARMQSQPHPSPHPRTTRPGATDHQPSHTSTSSSTLISTPTAHSPLPPTYRQHPYPDSSPFGSTVFDSVQPYGHDERSAMSPSYSAFHGDDEEMLDDGVLGMHSDAEREAIARYEEANRLLGELEVVRRRRWGENGG
ncbi:hypothetical protein IAU60_000341 [Kwoniella sp. DSM 27419]